MAVAWLDAACASSETVRARKEATTLASMRGALGELRRKRGVADNAAPVAPVAPVVASVAEVAPVAPVVASVVEVASVDDKAPAKTKPQPGRAKRVRRKRA